MKTTLKITFWFLVGFLGTWVLLGCTQGRSPLEVGSSEWEEACVFDLDEAIPLQQAPLCNFEFRWEG